MKVRINLALLILIVWGTLIQAQDNQLTHRLTQATQAHNQGQLQTAITKFQQALKIDPKNVYAYSQLGLIYAKKNSFSVAERMFERAVSYDSRDTFSHLWLGIIFIKNEQLDLAFNKFQQILQYEPDNADGYYFLGTIYSFRREDELAKQAFEKSRSLNSNDPETHYRLAKAYQRLDYWDVAEKEFIKTIELNKNHVSAMNGLGWLFYNQGNRSRAEHWWKEVLKKSPNNLEAKDSLAKSCNDLANEYLQKRQISKARQLWRKALTYDRKNKAAGYFLKRY